jgi:hypothetical protein
MLILSISILAPVVAALALPEVNSLGIPSNLPANETQLYPPYTYVSSYSYIPEAQ